VKFPKMQRAIRRRERRKPVRILALTALAATLAYCSVAGSVGSAGIAAASRATPSLAPSSSSASGDDDPWSLAVSSDGKRVFVTGRSGGAQLPGADYATIAYDSATGAKEWVGRYDGPRKAGDEAYSVAVSGDGTRVFVTGISHGGKKTSDDYATVAYRATTGKKLWVARYNGPASRRDYAYDIAVSSDGKKVFVTGGSVGGDYLDATVAYNAATGKRLWVARSEMGGSVAVSSDGQNVFVTGEDFNTVAYNAATGATVWFGRYEGPGEDYGDFDDTTVAVSGDGTRVFVTGTSEGKTTGLDYATVAFDAATGARLWVARYDGPTSAEAELGDFASALAVSPDGTKVFVTGFSEDAPAGADSATVAYDAATGTQLWVMRDADGGESLAVSADGTKVFVTGINETAATIRGDFGTAAYDAATGVKLWAARYNGPGSNTDWGRSLAVSGDGMKVFVTGLSDGGATGTDYATIAYNAATGANLWVTRYDAPAKACVVPKVRGLSLAAAKARIRRANCAVGKVTRADSRTKKGRVLSQSPKAGTRLDLNEGDRTLLVRLVVSRGPKPRLHHAPRRRR
jgi:outer membrane protein assembly factor BamB